MGLWQTLFGFQGRIGRATLWLSGAAVLLLDLTMVVLVSDWVQAVYVQDGAPHRPDGRLVAAGFLVLAFLAVSVWAALALKVKRCHDLGQSGQQLSVGLIPVVGVAILLAELGFRPGQGGPNRFGDPPGMGPDDETPERLATARAATATAAHGETDRRGGPDGPAVLHPVMALRSTPAPRPAAATPAKAMAAPPAPRPAARGLFGASAGAARGEAPQAHWTRSANHP